MCCDALCKYFPDRTPISVLESVIAEVVNADLINEFQTADECQHNYHGDPQHNDLFNVWKKYKDLYSIAPEQEQQLETTIVDNFMDYTIDDMTEIEYIDHVSREHSSPPAISSEMASIQLALPSIVPPAHHLPAPSTFIKSIAANWVNY